MGAIAGRLGAIFSEYASNDKSKILLDFQDGGYVAGSGTVSDDTVNVRLGTKSIKLTENNNVGNLLYTDKNNLVLNGETFSSGASSDSSDYIHFTFFVSDATKVSNVYLSISSEAIYAGVNYAEVLITGIVSGWNSCKILKSNFNFNGSMTDFSTIGSVRMGFTSLNNASGVYVSFQQSSLISKGYEMLLADRQSKTMVQKALCKSWKLDMSTGMGDSTSLGDEWKTNISLLSEYKITVDSMWENDDLNFLTQELGMILYISTTGGYRYETQVKISSKSIDNAVDGITTNNLEYTGNKEIYYSSQIIM
jgi:hypothetical protein